MADRLKALELKKRMEQEDELLVINVLDEEAFEKEHIPRSENVPGKHEDFVQRIERLAGRKDRPIVVYCSSSDCDASPQAAKKLEKAGFTNVRHFAGGMAEWKRAGHEVQSGAPAPTR